MKRQILFMEPVFKEMIWGGERLREEFHYNTPSDRTGECWAISAHQNGDCIIKSGSFTGQHLSTLWRVHKELFGNSKGESFPLLIKIIDAKEDLSIQVHPDDEYAKEKENGSLGKTECWYILDCNQEGSIVIGHNARNKEELRQMIHQNKWSQLIHTVKIRKGDFFQINPGTVHAIKAGTLILETQQSSDITYRLYDYDRLSDGKPRELHIEKSIDVIGCPQEVVIPVKNVMESEDTIIEELVHCEFYTVKKYTIKSRFQLQQNKAFMLVSIVEGKGTVDNYPVQKGDHFILPYQYGECIFCGSLEAIISYI